MRWLFCIGAALAAIGGYVFGVHGTFAAVVALAIVVGALVVERPWVHVTLAGSQLAVCALVMARVLPERSRVPIRLSDHPDWNVRLAQIALQGVYLGAFLAGRAAARRYRLLTEEIEASTRDADRQEALLDEARADYTRAVEIARQGAVAPPGPRAIGRPLTVDETAASATLERPSAVTVDDRGLPAVEPVVADLTDASRAGAWDRAHQAKMRQEDLAAVGLSVVGGGLIAILTPDLAPRLAAWISLTGILVAFAVRRAFQRRDPHAITYGPWLVVAALGIGPIYAWGVHSGITAVVATLLFAGGLFQEPGASRRDRLIVVSTVMGAHAAVFALIVAGAIPDEGIVPVELAGVAGWVPYALHLGLQATYFVAYRAGNAVDTRFADAYRRADTARHEALRRRAMLRETRADIDEALRRIGGGLFTGTTVGGYAVGRLIGRGGMGEVYEATDGRGARVALKLLRGERAGDPSSLARFAGEADVLGRVESPFLARVLSVGSAGELPFIAMTFVEGRSLAALLRERERLSVAGVASLVRDVARGLHEVHAAGFVHLDVKPSNILLTEELEMGSRWCLVDFGIARGALEAGTSVAGTPQYMAPEQARGEAVDARADLYSLCLVVTRALLGRPAAATGESFAGLRGELAAVLRKGLDPDPSARFATALELRVAFERAL
jgi:hypothetical protein